MRIKAIEALVDLKMEKGTAVLQELAEKNLDEKQWLAEWVVFGLGELDQKNAPEQLSRFLVHPASNVRDMTFRELWWIGDPAAATEVCDASEKELQRADTTDEARENARRACESLRARAE